jgi:hypothetical protein
MRTHEYLAEGTVTYAVRAVKGSSIGQNADMVSYMVRAATESACQRELDRLCERLGAVPTTAPMRASGPGWMARAVQTPAAPADEGQSRE